ncbi:hypothetical protein AAY473_022609 [Plecturocebus cupreus]
MPGTSGGECFLPDLAPRGSNGALVEEVRHLEYCESPQQEEEKMKNHLAALECFCLVSQGSYYVAQAGLKLLTSSSAKSSAKHFTCTYTLNPQNNTSAIVFLVEKRFHYVHQAVLQHLTSSDPPILASQSAGITGGYEDSESKTEVQEVSILADEKESINFLELDQEFPMSPLLC